MSKALRAIEAERSEKLALQTVLNNTRAAYGKLRNEVTDLEKKLALRAANARTCATSSPIRRTCCARPRRRAPRSPSRWPPAAPRSRNWNPSSRRKPARPRRCARRTSGSTTGWPPPTSAPSRSNPTSTARASACRWPRTKSAPSRPRSTRRARKQARLSRKLAETEASLNAAQGRLRHVEANYAELNTERARLATALDEANERSEHERANQRTRFEALQARAGATEKLLGEAREHLLARAEEIRDFDRRLSVVAIERDALQTRVSPTWKPTASSAISSCARWSRPSPR